MKHSVKEGIEIAGLLLHGETVLLSTGSGDEIAASPAARKVMERADFVFHTHPDAYSRQGPTGPDLAAAGEETHYLLTPGRAYAYADGVLETGDLRWLSARYLQALKNSARTRDETSARYDLNLLIAEQDRLNQTPEEERETWLRGGTYSYSPSLTASSVTTLPGSPYPYVMSASNAGPASLSYDATAKIFILNYQVTDTLTYSGMNISFDDASSPAVETGDLSTLTYLILGVVAPTSTLKLEFVDVNGNKDYYTLKNISSSKERFWKIPLSSLLSTVDKTKIRRIQIYETTTTTTSTTRTGTAKIRINGLNLNAPLAPTVTSTVPAYTNQTTLTLSGRKEAYTSILINGVEVIGRNASTSWSYTVSLSSEGNNTFNITSKNTIGKVSPANSLTLFRDTAVPTGSIDINSGSPYTHSTPVTLTLSALDGSGSGVSQMRFSTDNITWSASEAYGPSKTLTLPSGDGPKTVYVKYYDKAGNASLVYSKSITLDTTAPSGSIIINNNAAYSNSLNAALTLAASDAASGLDAMRFSRDGGQTWTDWEVFSETKSFTLPLGDGTKEVQCQIRDRVGWVSTFTDTILLDTVPPEVVLTSTAFSTNSNPTLAYTNDGTLETRELALAAGENLIHITVSDPAGNTTGADFLIYYAASFPAWEGDPNRLIEIPARVSADGANLLSVTLEGGIRVFYENGAIHHMTFDDGTFVQNVVLDAGGRITEAVLFPSDGRILIVRGGVLIQEVLPDGRKIDYTAQGLMVKETPVTGGPAFYYYERDSQGAILRIWSQTGGLSVAYDAAARLEWVFSGVTVRKFDSGILTRIGLPSGMVVDYALTEEIAADGTTQFRLELQNSAAIEALPETLQTEIQIQSALFHSGRNPLEILLRNGTKFFFTNGLVTRVLDAQGNETAYDYDSRQGLLLQLGVNKPGVRSEYNFEGKLSRIVTGEAGFDIKDEKIASMDLKDGSAITNLSLDPEGNVTGATIRDPDGTVRFSVSRTQSRSGDGGPAYGKDAGPRKDGLDAAQPGRVKT